MEFIKEKINITAKKLLSLSQVKLFDLTGVEMTPCDYKQNNTPPVEGWSDNITMEGAEKHYWLRARFDTPAAGENEQLLLVVSSDAICGWDAVNPQGLVYLNGEMTQGVDTNHREVYLEPDTHYEIYVYFYSGVKEAPFHLDFTVVREYKNVLGLYYDLFTPWEAFKVLNENTQEYFTILSALECACNRIDFRAPYSEAFFSSVDCAREYLEEEFYSKQCSTAGKPVVHCIGHTHIDVEWKWARAQTREKMQRSFSSAKALMRKYPEYLFTLSQPELYRYLMEEAPEEYEVLKDFVKQGRWEPEGAFFVECDCNLVSGESFVRQLLHGKRFFKDEFGVESKILFLPDVFGYSAAMPQILKKSGVEHFVTSKISWNETNLMPYDSFLWQGIDGTEIYTSFITGRHALKEHKFNKIATYVGIIDAPYMIGCWDRYQQKEYNSNTIFTFGYGDGGGGPTREMLEKYRRLTRGIPGVPVAKTNFLLPALDEAKAEFDRNSRKLGRTPRWVGELYLEFHRGTYTSIAKIKRSNRKMEFALSKLEGLSYLDLLNAGSYDYDGLYRAWRKVLHNQFHDILPGSSIHEVYEGTDKDYEILSEYCDGEINGKLKSLSEQVGSDGGVFVYNPLGFAYAPVVKLEGKTVESLEPVGAFGWKVVKDYISDSLVAVNGLTAENELYRLTLDETGAIVSLYDKKACRETVKAGERASRFVAFEDEPYQYDAWEISKYYKAKPYDLDCAAQITPVVDGSRAGFKVIKRYMDSTIEQNIWLYSKGRRIDFETKIDWHQKHQLLKVFFPVDVYADKATYEIQFGHVTRPTHQNTSWDSARFEVCAHKWVDISENGYGVAILNDCKYGFSAEGTTLALTALKCALDPDPYADEGEHIFTYSLVPHMGSLYDAGVIRESYKLNQPADAIAIPAGKGKLPEQFSLVCADAENVMIETVKRAEDDDSMIVRMYESFGGRCTAGINVAESFERAYLCDLMENEEQPLELKDGKVTLELGAFEIATIKFKKG